MPNLSFCTAEFEAYADCLRADFSIPVPETPNNALELYFLLIQDISALMTEV